MSADLYEQIAAEYLFSANRVTTEGASDFMQELVAEMVSLSNMARTEAGAA